jgi:uncharacterized protein YfaA (DUF2138 family)
VRKRYSWLTLFLVNATLGTLIMQMALQFIQRHRILAVLALCIVSLSVWAGYRYWHRLAHYSGTSRIAIDMRKPSIVLRTHNLAELPQDIAQMPLLTGLVDEKLAFYYEDDEERLSLEGSLRRMAYEHDLRLEDRFLAALMAAPAELAFWQSSKGRPEYFVASIERSALSTLAQTLAKIALNDGQLKLVKNFSLAGKTLPLYTLTYGAGRTLAFFADAQRWVIVSQPELALDGDGDLTESAQAVLGELLQGKAPWQDLLSAPQRQSAGVKHSVALGVGMLSLGYSRFLPALTGLRMDFKDAAWQAQLRIDHAELPKDYAVDAHLQTLWRATPARQALCSAQLVNWSAATQPLQKLVEDDAAVKTALAALDPMIAVCWFANSRLNSPLFVAHLNGPLPAQGRSLLEKLATKVWAEPGTLPSLEAGSGGKKDSANAVFRMGAEIASGHGPLKQADGTRMFTPTLVQKGDLIYFSPDRRNVDAALAVAEKRAPALADALPRGVWLAYEPKRLAQLFRTEVGEVLPPSEESYFADIARTQLWPRLDAWGRYQPPMHAVVGKAAKDGFAPLQLHAAKAGVAP